MTIALTGQKTKFIPGDTLVHYNMWTGWDMRDKKGWDFDWLSPTECEQLAPGDIIWVDVELHPNGKVYGCTAAKVIEIYGSVADDNLTISYIGKPSGMKRVSVSKKHSDFGRLQDEKAALEFVEQNPLAMNAGSFG